MSADQSDPPAPFDMAKQPFQRTPEGMLQREHFTAERVDYLREQLSKSGLWTFISNEEREASRQAILSRHPGGADLWVFGYGSLMWNPALNVTDSRKARVKGWQRSFCLSLILGRARPDAPGLMLAIEEGDELTGVVHRIDRDAIESETSILWMREMLSGAYKPTWVTAETPDGIVEAITFVIDKTHARYACVPDLTEQARRIAAAEGDAGNNRDYLYRCRGELVRMGVEDAYVEALFAAVTQLTGEPGDPLPLGGMRPMTTVHYNDLESLVGKDVGESEWVLVDQDRVNKFADATGDHQWIHVDPEKAKAIGGTIAHGYLTLSLLPFLGAKILQIQGVSRGINYGSNKVRFTNMVPVGSKVRAKQKVLGVDAKGGGKQITNEMTIEIEGKDRPAMVAETITIVYP